MLQDVYKNLDSRIALLTKARGILEQAERAIFDAGVADKIVDYCGGVDFDNLTHQEAVKVMLALGGKWTKEYRGTTINYLQTIHGVLFRLWGCQPPRSCRIVEEKVLVPEKPAVPAHEQIIRKLVCTNGSEETITKLPEKDSNAQTHS